MNTKIIMTTSAISLGVAGIMLTFMPEEILIYLGLETTKSFQLILQILGALYFSFAMLNWMTRASVIGGIYNRPIVVANATHFTIAGLALIKGLFSNPSLPNAVWIIACFYIVFAISFGLILFQSPLRDKKSE